MGTAHRIDRPGHRCEFRAQVKASADSAPLRLWRNVCGMQIYLYLNAVLYALFALWCTVKATGTANSLGYVQLSNSGRSEYLVIYGGLQIGLALMFWLVARDSQFHRLGLQISLGLYLPIVAYRAITVLKHWPVSSLTLGVGALELGLLIAAAWLYLMPNARA